MVLTLGGFLVRAGARGNLHAVVEAMPDHVALLASFGNDKVARTTAAFLERLLLCAEERPWMLQLFASNASWLYDKYIERFNSLLARQLSGTCTHARACAPTARSQRTGGG